MRQQPGTAKPTAESMVKDIRRRIRKHHSAEEKNRVVLDRPRKPAQSLVARMCGCWAFSPVPRLRMSSIIRARSGEALFFVMRTSCLSIERPLS